MQKFNMLCTETKNDRMWNLTDILALNAFNNAGDYQWLKDKNNTNIQWWNIIRSIYSRTALLSQILKYFSSIPPLRSS